MPTKLETRHRVFQADARRMEAVADASVHLVVTSPPYPMIAMWDGVFSRQDARIAPALAGGRPREGFERMHALLDPVWQEIHRVLLPGGFACINIGDAVRSFNGEFGLYANHVRTLASLQRIGFTCLPAILWRKPTNAPTKFMGSGVLPAGAYVTLEHEFILIVRKGGKRRFSTEEQQRRRESAIFWEERNIFFSDIWTDIRGAGQAIGGNEPRGRSAAFPSELALRLILMYAIKGDTVLDPFWGTGTTTLAAAAAGRSSIGYEIEPALTRMGARFDAALLAAMQARVRARLERHTLFVRDREARKGPLKYRNRHYGFKVVTRQEQELFFDVPGGFKARSANEITCAYESAPSV
ncbi:MAG: site-specific DNA-methyltransferase [Desulfobacterales bacterium]|nr:site-specific DNA-methyltransferase [Desulfobacterales bacterium]